jgi:RNA polymerase sigma-70 factor (ECF subfamily)
MKSLEEIEVLSFESLYYSYKNKLLTFLLCRINSTEKAEDIVQDVFMKIWINRKNINKIKNINAYIFKITTNRMIDGLRRFSEENIFHDIIDMEESIDDALLKKEQRQILQKAVKQLSPQQKKIYEAHYEQEKPLKDVAKEMNLSLSTVQNHINKMFKNICRNFSKENYV